MNYGKRQALQNIRYKLAASQSVKIITNQHMMVKQISFSRNVKNAITTIKSKIFLNCGS